MALPHETTTQLNFEGTVRPPKRSAGVITRNELPTDRVSFAKNGLPAVRTSFAPPIDPDERIKRRKPLLLLAGSAGTARLYWTALPMAGPLFRRVGIVSPTPPSNLKGLPVIHFPGTCVADVPPDRLRDAGFWGDDLAILDTTTPTQGFRGLLENIERSVYVFPHPMGDTAEEAYRLEAHSGRLNPLCENLFSQGGIISLEFCHRNRRWIRGIQQCHLVTNSPAPAVRHLNRFAQIRHILMKQLMILVRLARTAVTDFDLVVDAIELQLDDTSCEASPPRSIATLKGTVQLRLIWNDGRELFCEFVQRLGSGGESCIGTFHDLRDATSARANVDFTEDAPLSSMRILQALSRPVLELGSSFSENLQILRILDICQEITQKWPLPGVWSRCQTGESPFEKDAIENQLACPGMLDSMEVVS